MHELEQQEQKELQIESNVPWKAEAAVMVEGEGWQCWQIYQLFNYLKLECIDKGYKKRQYFSAKEY